MFIYPLMSTASQNDELSQIAIQTIVADFTNKVAQEGKITQASYDEFIQKLYATGNTFEVELETKILDENPGKKTNFTTQDMIGENVYYSEYTTMIEEKLMDPDCEQTYYLKKGDYITVTVKNTNITMGTQLKNFFYKLVGKDTYTIGATVSKLVINTGKSQNDDTSPITPTPEDEIPVIIEPSITPVPDDVTENRLITFEPGLLLY